MTSPARVLRDRVEAMLQPGHDVAFVTDPDGEKGAVLIAIATPKWCGVFAIDRAEYSLEGALALARLFGFEQRPSPPPSRAGINLEGESTMAKKQPPKAPPGVPAKKMPPGKGKGGKGC